MDTLAYAKKLEAAGVPENQAELQAEALAEALREQALTRGDLLETRADLLGELKNLENKLNDRIEHLKSDALDTGNKNIQEIQTEMRRIETNAPNKLFLKLIGVIVVATAILGILIGVFN